MISLLFFIIFLTTQNRIQLSSFNSFVCQASTSSMEEAQGGDDDDDDDDDYDDEQIEHTVQIHQ